MNLETSVLDYWSFNCSKINITFSLIFGKFKYFDWEIKIIFFHKFANDKEYIWVKNKQTVQDFLILNQHVK